MFSFFNIIAIGNTTVDVFLVQIVTHEFFIRIENGALQRRVSTVSFVGGYYALSVDVFRFAQRSESDLRGRSENILTQNRNEFLVEKIDYIPYIEKGDRLKILHDFYRPQRRKIKRRNEEGALFFVVVEDRVNGYSFIGPVVDVGASSIHVDKFIRH